MVGPRFVRPCPNRIGSRARALRLSIGALTVTPRDLLRRPLTHSTGGRRHLRSGCRRSSGCEYINRYYSDRCNRFYDGRRYRRIYPKLWPTRPQHHWNFLNAPEFSGKWIELLRTTVPNLQTISSIETLIVLLHTMLLFTLFEAGILARTPSSVKRS